MFRLDRIKRTFNQWHREHYGKARTLPNPNGKESHKVVFWYRLHHSREPTFTSTYSAYPYRWLTSTRQPCLHERKSATVPANERITVSEMGRQDDATLLPSPLKGGYGNHSSFRCSLACHLTTDRMTTPHDPRANEVAEDMLGEGWTGYACAKRTNRLWTTMENDEDERQRHTEDSQPRKTISKRALIKCRC